MNGELSPDLKEKVGKRASVYYKTDKYEEKKLKQNAELWEKVKRSDDLQKIVELKAKIERTKKARVKLTSDIKEMKKGLETVKTSINTFVREQTTNLYKMTFPKTNTNTDAQNQGRKAEANK